MEERLTEEEIKLVFEDATGKFSAFERNDLTLSENQEVALKTLLETLRKRLGIPTYFPLPPNGEENVLRARSIYNEALRLLHNQGIFQPWTLVETYMKSIFGEENADFATSSL